MKTEPLTKIIADFVAGMPAELREKLDEVEILVYDTIEHANLGLREEFEDPIAAMPPDAKGVFIGEPLEIEEGSDDEEAIFPDGVIALVAGNVASPEEGIFVFCHEIGHALGLDEDGVKALGLAVAAKEQPPAKEGSSEAPAVT